ncbi:hypothetical protein C0J52_21510 [Blattella germanica]|nr:hypothetical protein C0J52_21510 [Blattella germanica]
MATLSSLASAFTNTIGSRRRGQKHGNSVKMMAHIWLSSILRLRLKSFGSSSQASILNTTLT